MSQSMFDYGDLVRATVSFTAAGSAVDPTTVTFQMQNPAGTETAYVYGTDAQLVRSGAGTYYVAVNASSVGQWYVRFSTTGTYQTAIEDSFYVRTSKF